MLCCRCSVVLLMTFFFLRFFPMCFFFFFFQQLFVRNALCCLQSLMLSPVTHFQVRLGKTRGSRVFIDADEDVLTLASFIPGGGGAGGIEFRALARDANKYTSNFIVIFNLFTVYIFHFLYKNLKYFSFFSSLGTN